MPTLDTEHILERDGFFVALTHRICRLLLQSINGTNASHETIAYIHQHARRKQEGSNTEHCHDTNQMDNDRVEGTFFISTQEIIPSKQDKRVGCTSPGVNQEEQKVLCLRQQYLKGGRVLTKEDERKGDHEQNGKLQIFLTR